MTNPFLSRASQLPVQAAFTEEQIVALRTHVLPLFASLESWHGPGHLPRFLDEPVRGIGSAAKFTPAGLAFSTYAGVASFLVRLLESIVARKSPAKRHSDLQLALKEGTTYFKGYKKWPPAVWPFALTRLAMKAKSNKLTPLGQEALGAVSSPYFQLLKKSWPYILAEAGREHGEILKKFGLQVSTANLDALVKKFQKALPDWTVTELKQTNYLNKPQPSQYVALSPDRLKKITLGISEYDPKKSWALIPAYRMTPGSIDDHDWYSWARLGVDGGETTFEFGDTMEYAVELMIEKIDAAIARRKDFAENGKDYNFGPKTLRLKPDGLATILETLRSGKSYTIAPSGFGTAYIFSTRRGPYSSLASAELSKLVGTPVYYFSQDRD